MVAQRSCWQQISVHCMATKARVSCGLSPFLQCMQISDRPRQATGCQNDFVTFIDVFMTCELGLTCFGPYEEVCLRMFALV